MAIVDDADVDDGDLGDDADDTIIVDEKGTATTKKAAAAS